MKFKFALRVLSRVVENQRPLDTYLDSPQIYKSNNFPVLRSRWHLRSALQEASPCEAAKHPQTLRISVYLSSGVPFRTPLDKYPRSSGGPLCETLGTILTYQVTYRSVRHLISTRVDPFAKPWERYLYIYQVSYHPAAHLMSIRGAALSHFASAWASRYDWFQSKQSKCHKSNCARWCLGCEVL